MTLGKTNNPNERRRYIRLDSVFPVQFRLLSMDGAKGLTEWIQGFTHDLSSGGLLLDVHNLTLEQLNLIKEKQVLISLRIFIPVRSAPLEAVASIAWLNTGVLENEACCIGLTYKEVNSSQKAKLMRYIWAKKLFFPFIVAIIFVLTLGFSINTYINVKLVKGNKVLIGQLIKILQDSVAAKQKIKDINKEKEDLQLKIQALQVRMQNIEDEKSKLQEKAEDRVQELNATIEKLIKEEGNLQEKLIELQGRENTVTEELLRLDKKKAVLEKANFDKMFKWLIFCQNSRTGLVMSLDTDKQVDGWAFTYDQSLAAQTYINFVDFERAKKIFDFYRYKARKSGGLFFNAYYGRNGAPAENVVYIGPNIWMGLAVMQYTRKTNDSKYLRLAEDIAFSIINLQKQNKDGGIKAGPNEEWISLEHNLDAYAFLNMLYKFTGKRVYLDARDNVLNWLLLNASLKQNVPVIRGKGDSSIVTDSYAWSISAIGPEKLNELGMNPDKIVESVEQNYAVEVPFNLSEEQSIKIKGFDIALQSGLARPGVISTEWTSQMIINFRKMAEYYRKKDMIGKAVSYERKADEYLAELCNMIIPSRSASGKGQGCLPYASSDFVDTGHGWVTSQGKSAGSVSATTYAIFAYYNYNPLEAK